MKVFTSAIRLKASEKEEEVNITDQVEAILFESSVKDGIVVVFTGHSTAAVHLNNPDRALESDFHDFLRGVIPNKADYKHNKGEYGKNADAHIKSTVIGHSVTIPVSKGRLQLGQWQAIFFSEFDGPRSRLISVKVMGTTGT